MNRSTLRERALAGEQLLGGLVRMPSEELVEMCAMSGFDFILIDCEHGPADVSALRQHIAFAALHGLSTLVRVGKDEDPLTLRALDQGADGIVSPHTDDVTDARHLVDAVHYPPLGTRGFATYTRAGGFGTRAADEHRARLANTLVIGMIECPSALRQTAEIIATPGIDGLMVGPADLAATRTETDPSVADGIATVAAVVDAAGKLRMDIVNTREDAETAFAFGTSLVVYNMAASLMGHLAGLAGAARRRS